MPIPWKELEAARKLIKLDRKEKRRAERRKIRAERRKKAEESSAASKSSGSRGRNRGRQALSSTSDSSSSSSSSALSSSPSRKRSRRSVTPQARGTVVGAPERPQQPKSPEVKVVGSKPAPRKEAAKIPPLPVAQPPPPAVPPPPQQQKKPAAAVEPIREVEVQGRIKRGLQVKVTNPEAEARSADHSHKRPAKERLGSPVNRDREEVVEKLRELAAGTSSGTEARPPPPRGAEADKHRRTATRNVTVLHEEAYAIIPIHLDDFRVVNDLVEQLQFLRHPNLREDIIKFRNVLLRRLNDQALGPEAQRAVTSYCRTRTPKRK